MSHPQDTPVLLPPLSPECLPEKVFSILSPADRPCVRFGVQALAACPAASAGLLVRLDLADNTLGEEGGSTLAEALSSQPGLTHVNLRDCNLEVSDTERYPGDMAWCKHGTYVTAREHVIRHGRYASSVPVSLAHGGV